MSDDLSFSKFYNIVDGELCSSNTISRAVDPATREELWEVPIASEQDVDNAVQAAKLAFKSWRKTPFEERVQSLNAWGDACKPYLKEFGEVIMKENGKPVGQTIQLYRSCNQE